MYSRLVRSWPADHCGHVQMLRLDAGAGARGRSRAGELREPASHSPLRDRDPFPLFRDQEGFFRAFLGCDPPRDREVESAESLELGYFRLVPRRRPLGVRISPSALASKSSGGCGNTRGAPALRDCWFRALAEYEPGVRQLEEAAVAIRAAIEVLDSLGLYDYRERAQRISSRSSGSWPSVGKRWDRGSNNRRTRWIIPPLGR